MAVAGMHNGPSFFDDSQVGKRSMKASTLLQLWREIEGEQLNGPSCGPRHLRNGPDSEHLDTATSIGQGSDTGDRVSQDSHNSENQCFIGSVIEHDDDNSVVSEQSSDLGDVERERVRQVFREWISSDSKSGCHGSNHSRLWDGENVCEKVRFVREWMQMSSQQRNSIGLLRDRFAAVGSEIEQARDELVISQPEVDARRPIRRLCGRQAILDLHQRAQSDRRRELLGLLEQRPVSDFAYRKRIQALLKGRFLQNKRLVVDERPSSVAANELGLMRERHTVSDLREGFLSKLDNSACSSVNNVNSDSAYCGEHSEESEFTCGEREDARVPISQDLRSHACGSNNLDEFLVQVMYEEETIMNNEVTEQEVSLGDRTSDSREEPTTNTEGSTQEISTETDHCRDIEQIKIDEASLESGVVHFSGLITVFERNTSSDLVSRYASAQGEEFRESVNATEDESRSREESSTDQCSPETSHNNVEEHYQLQEYESNHNLEEAIDNWLDMPSREIGRSVSGTDSLYFPEDDENARNGELREISSRQCVSSLLRSGFRESLDRVLQSQVERLGNDSDDWEHHDTSSPGLLSEEEQDQLNNDQTSAVSDGYERNPLAPSSTFIAASQRLWDALQGANSTHHGSDDSDQQLQPEWEVINELRFDIAQLHQRMNHMESVLEECMDMQIELQRFMRQEVYAALNRSNFPSADHHGERDRWDHVRKGICCLCRDSKIDSLLYRCGHMCTCSECAGNLTRRKGQCPMCQVPVTEVARVHLPH